MKLGFIDYYLDEWHANNYPARIREASDGTSEVAYAYGEIPSPFSGVTSAQWCDARGLFCATASKRLLKKATA